MPSKGEPKEFTEFEAAVAQVLLSLNEGDVLSYGDVAAEAGYPGAARAVGTFLKHREGFPWWRVVNSTGRLVPGNEDRQATLLRSEGVQVVNGRVKPD